MSELTSMKNRALSKNSNFVVEYSSFYSRSISSIRFHSV